MGVTGPIPNRSTDLSRERDANRGDRPPITKGISRPSAPYRAPDEWHDIAKKLYNGVVASGQADFYQQSDWALLYFVCDEVDRYQKAGKRSSMMFAAIMSALSTLMVAEGDRRRVRIELGEEDKAPQDIKRSRMDGYRTGLHLVPKAA